MENRTNKIIVLEDGKNYAVLRHILYQGRTFYLASEVINESDLSQDMELFEQVMYEGKESLVKFRDPEITKIILDNMKVD